MSYQENAILQTFTSKANNSSSFIDHFIVSDNLIDAINDYYTTDDLDNFSDHLPLHLSLKITISTHMYQATEDDRQFISWNTASNSDILRYKNSLDGNLCETVPPLQAILCNDYMCTEHSVHLQHYHDKVVNACISASLHMRKKSVLKRPRSIPGWNEMVKDLHGQALFWHSMWKSIGCPSLGLIADIRRSTRAKYHFSVKQAKRLQDTTRANKLAADLMNNNYIDFWKKVRSINREDKKLPSSINDISGEENISELFKNKYSELYNSVSYKEQDMLQHLEMLNKNLHQTCVTGNCYSNHTININDVKKAISVLKKGKRDGNCEMSSEHLIFGTNLLLVHISMLFQGMFNHGFSPSGFLESVILPIPKNKRKSLSDTKNYCSGLNAQ